jgi:hypothetical protein
MEPSRKPMNGHVLKHLHPNQILEKYGAVKAANNEHLLRNLYPNQTLEVDRAVKVATKWTCATE